MTASMLLWLVGAVALGVALVVWGIRGKRLNDHPVCRQCRFDLIGQPEGTVTCPECGAGLKRPGFIRIGQRRKRPVAIIIGMLAIALPGVFIGTFAIALLTGADLNTYKPLGVLKWEAKSAPAARAKLIGAELLRRIQDKKTPAATYDRIVQVALDYQEDKSRPWSTEWGDIIEQAETDSKLSKDDKSRYWRQMTVLEFQVRPRVRTGDTIPVIAKLKEGRIGSTSAMMGQCMLDEVTVNGAKAGNVGQTYEGGVFFGGEGVGWVRLFGAKSRYGMGASAGGASTLLHVPASIEPGAAKLHVHASVEMADQSAMRSITWTNGSGKSKSPDTSTHDVDLAIEFLSEASASVEVVPPTPDLSAKLEKLLRPLSAAGYDYQAGQPAQVHVQFNTDGKPIDFAFDVFLRSGGKEWRLGALTSGELAAGSGGPYGYPGEKGRQVYGQARGFKLSTADVVLRPSEKLALQTLDLTRIYGGELVFEDVDIQWPNMGRFVSPPQQSGSILSKLLNALGL